MDARIAIRNLWKVYGGGVAARDRAAPPPAAELRRGGCVIAVEDVSLDVLRGEILVIMGLSGSGKSTLLRCINRLIEPTWGTVTLDGRSMGQMDEAELRELRRRKMGMVFQNFALLPFSTVIENVAMPMRVRGEGREARLRQARRMIELVGLAGKEERLPSELSGGQQQRVGIARSLAVDPEIWFLDEPFSALDPLIRREMQDEFLRLQAMFHKTILFVTHDFEEAVRIASRIVIMRDGRVVQVGSAEELVLNPADDYVASFTRHVNRARVVTVRALMEPDPSLAVAGEPVAAALPVAEAAVRLRDGDGAMRPVVDEGGRRIGAISPPALRDQVIDMMAQA